MHTRSPEDHLAAIRDMCWKAAKVAPNHPFSAPPTEVIRCHRDQALGLVLAADLVAENPSPRFDNSQMDGYALSDSHLAKLPGNFVLGDTIAAGADPAEIYPDGLAEEVAPIMTGAKLPAGTAAIVPVERCTPSTFGDAGDAVSIPVVPAGQFIRRTGEDLPSGATLLARGTRINAAAVGLLASQGIEFIEVYRPARIAIITGGDEIGGPGPAAIPDANGPMLDALAKEHGIEVVARVHTTDDIDTLRGVLRDALAVSRPDAVVTSGGISHGRFEVIRKLLEDTEGAWFGHVSQQPAGPQGLALFAGVPVLCLPGNPVSTLVSFRTLVAPVLGYAPAPRKAELACPVRGLDNRDQFLRARRVDEGIQARVEPVGGAGSHLIAQAVPADCLLRIPAGAELPAGAEVTIYPLEGWDRR